jgi:peptidyl-prolyl cis-trans isomerase D
VGNVNGSAIQYPEFDAQVQRIGESYKQQSNGGQIDDETWSQIRSSVWEQFVHDNIMSEIYDRLGIAVTPEELFDMVQGNNINQRVQSLFTNQQTGQFDKSVVVRTLKAIDAQGTPEQKEFWANVEREIVRDRLYMKYIGLLRQGLYVTKAEAQAEAVAAQNSANIQFIGVPYSQIPDSAVSVTEKELKAWYEAHKEEYRQEAARVLEYVAFPVTATAADDKTTEKAVADLKSDFELTNDNIQFVNANSDLPFENEFKKREELTPDLAALAFDEPRGTVYGPYKDGDTWKLAKTDTIINLPDSVHARHILLRVQSQQEYSGALALADSLKKSLENGASFETLVAQNDPSSPSGGDLGWFKRGQMVQSFEDASFFGEVGKYYVVTSEFGVHVLQILKKGVETPQARLAVIAQSIIPSTQTRNNIFATASKFASAALTPDAFENEVKTQGLEKRSASVNDHDITIYGLPQSRQIIRAAFLTNKKSVLENNEGSTIFEAGDNFVIAMLKGQRKKGIPTFEEVKLRVELAVKQHKKADILAEKIAATGTSDLAALAQAMNVDVKTAENIDYNTTNITGAGTEPALVGAVSALKQGQLSKPVKGNNAVYVVKAESVREKEQPDSYSEQQQLTQKLGYKAYAAYQILQKSADITEEMFKFY